MAYRPMERHAGGGQDLGRPQADAHTMVGIQPRHLRILRHHIHEYRQLLLKLETKPAWRKLSNIKAFELLELQHLVEMIDAYE